MRSLLTALDNAYVSTRQSHALILDIPVLAARACPFLAHRGLRAQVEVSPSERGIVLRTRDQILSSAGTASD